MTLGRDHNSALGSQDLAGQGSGHVGQSSSGRKRQRRGAQPPAQPHQVIDLVSQSSLELCLPGLPAGQEDTLTDEGGKQRQQGAAAAAGQKRLWGEIGGGDDVSSSTLPAVAVTPPSAMLWGSTRPRVRRARPTSADAAAAAAAMGSPIIILDDDTPAGTLSNNIKQQLHLQTPREGPLVPDRQAVTPVRYLNPIASPPMRPLSIAPNPSFASTGTGPAAAAAAAGAAQAAGPAARRRAARRMPPPAAAAAAAAAGAGLRRNSDSSSSSAEQVDIADADAALARKLMQEEEDRLLAQRLMQEEEQAVQVHQTAADRYRAQQMQAAAAAAGARSRHGHHRAAYRAPPGFTPPGYDPADTAGVQAQNMPPPPSAAGALGAAQQQQRGFDMGHAMAQVLLSMPMPRWRGGAGGGGGGGGAARRGLPATLVQMREAVLGMQRAGLPPHLLFSDRDFTADDYELLCRLDETVENRKGAATSIIESLPTQTVPAGGLPGAAAGEKLSCAVCLEEFAEGSELRCLPCLHKFHKGCIDTWLRQKAACPVCNRDCA